MNPMQRTISNLSSAQTGIVEERARAKHLYAPFDWAFAEAERHVRAAIGVLVDASTGERKASAVRPLHELHAESVAAGGDLFAAHWAVFRVEPCDGDDFHETIQRVDGPECVFASDDDAVCYVVWRATRYGCPIALKALQRLAARRAAMPAFEPLAPGMMRVEVFLAQMVEVTATAYVDVPESQDDAHEIAGAVLDDPSTYDRVHWSEGVDSMKPSAYGVKFPDGEVTDVQLGGGW
jgi:hypothetical protein